MGRPPIVVVYKKPKGRKHYLQVFHRMYVGDIIDSNKRKPPIPHDYELVEIGLGLSFVDEYKDKYNGKIIENE
jgi:hypothetical protein